MTEPRAQEASGGEGPDDPHTQPLSTGGAAERPTAEPAPERGGADAATPDSGDAADSTATRATPPRAGVPRGGPERRVTRTATGRQRRARLRLARIDPWSVLLMSLVVSLFLAVVVVVAVVALYAVLEAAGVPDSLNALISEVTRTPGEPEPEPLLSAGRALRAAGVLAVVDVVLVTALATLSAVLYNLCASFTGGLEVTLAEDA